MNSQPSDLVVSTYQQNTYKTVAQWQHLFKSLSTVAFTIDHTGQFVDVSQASSALWGYDPEELIGTFCLDIVVEQNHARTQRYFDQLMAGEKIPVFHNYFRKKDGLSVPMVGLPSGIIETKCSIVLQGTLLSKKSSTLLKSRTFWSALRMAFML